MEGSKQGNNQDVLFFTTHRSASMFIYGISRDLAKLKNLDYYSPNGGDFLFDEVDFIKNPEMFKNYKGFFGPIRFFVNTSKLEKSTILLHLRDPRDVLVSMFHAYCFSHRGPIKGNTGYRKKIAEEGIDKFCLKMVKEEVPDLIGDYGTGGHIKEFAGNILRRYQDYTKNLLYLPNTTIIRYEEMIGNFESWLEKVTSSLGFENKETIIKNLVLKYQREFSINEEDIYRHKRKIIPGDYKEKLKSETIKELNIIFEDTLQKLNYSK